MSLESSNGSGKKMPDLDMMTRIFDRLGSIDAKISESDIRRREILQGIESLTSRLDMIERITPLVEAMHPFVEDYKANKNKLAGLVLGVTTLATGVGFFASEVKAWFSHK